MCDTPESSHTFSGFLTDIDREIMQLKREEAKLITDIKAAAKTNNQAAMKVLAKALVRLRGQIAKLQGSSANLRGVSTNLTVRGCLKK
jgi:division protein CdvB (Snf7/Vps24/ESCRT-III family)